VSKPVGELSKEAEAMANYILYESDLPQSRAEAGGAALFEMARRLRKLDKLDERHQRGGRTPSGRRSIYCRCHTEWPCPDRRILDGEE
jgi:hypothetical protein